MDALPDPAIVPARPHKPVSAIARETLHRIAARKLPPTPENYAAVWREVADELPANDDTMAAPPVRSVSHIGVAPSPVSAA